MKKEDRIEIKNLKVYAYICKFKSSFLKIPSVINNYNHTALFKNTKHEGQKFKEARLSTNELSEFL